MRRSATLCYSGTSSVAVPSPDLVEGTAGRASPEVAPSSPWVPPAPLTSMPLGPCEAWNTWCSGEELSARAWSRYPGCRIPAHQCPAAWAHTSVTATTGLVKMTMPPYCLMCVWESISYGIKDGLFLCFEWGLVILPLPRGLPLQGFYDHFSVSSIFSLG